MAWLLDALRRNNSWTDLDFDADEAVVKGAAIQAHVLSGPEFTSGMVTYVVVTDLSLGLVCSLLDAQTPKLPATILTFDPGNK